MAEEGSRRDDGSEEAPAATRAESAGPQGTNGIGLTEELNAATSEAAGGSVVKPRGRSDGAGDD
jgi:ribosomal protein L11